MSFARRAARSSQVYRHTCSTTQTNTYLISANHIWKLLAIVFYCFAWKTMNKCQVFGLTFFTAKSTTQSTTSPKLARPRIHILKQSIGLPIESGDFLNEAIVYHQ